jgi:hypothetical protein
MDELGKMIGSVILVGVIMGGGTWIAKPRSERTAWRFVQYFFSAIAASLPRSYFALDRFVLT